MRVWDGRDLKGKGLAQKKEEATRGWELCVLPAAPLPKPAPLTEEELGTQSGGAAFPKSGDTRPRS